MDERIKSAIAEHAFSCYPAECCGLVVAVGDDEIYVACRNIAATASEHFVLSPHDYSAAEDRGSIVAIVHSHPNAPALPSCADMAMCEQAGVAKWVIVSLCVKAGSVVIDDWCEFEPTGYIAPLLGRSFVHSVHDCYALCRDYFRLERGIVLLDFPRADKWWDDGTSNLYIDNYERAGFVNVGPDVELQVGDGLLMQIRSKNGVPNHCGVFLGDGAFIHHFYGQLSRREAWGGLWARSLRAVLRYVGDQK